MSIKCQSKWLRSLKSRSQERSRICVFPYAGGSAAAFCRWRERLPHWISLELVQLPGRESRSNEFPASRVSDIVLPVADALLSENTPLVLFGHSMGSILAFELARELRRNSGVTVSALIVSGRGAPQGICRAPNIAHLESREMVDRLIKMYGGIPAEVLDDPQLVDVMARVLKPDLKIVECYNYSPEPPLDCPIAAFGGAYDPWVKLSELLAWNKQTCREFQYKLFPGNHFYFRMQDNEASLLSKLRIICGSVCGFASECS